MGRHLHIILLVLAFGLVQTVFGELVVYPKPSGAPSGSGFTVKVQQNGGNWITVPLYPATFKTEVRNGVTDAWCYFDFSGTVTVQITVDYTTLNSYWLLPDSTGFSSSKVSGSTKNGNTVTYTLSSSPKHNVFVVNQDYGSKALYILANLMETNAPTVSTPNVIYYGPGYHTIENITLTAGKTLYIAGGAVVKTKKIFIEPGDDNITIRGRGILEPSTDEVFIDCKDNKLYNDNFKMEGVIISDWGWHRGWTTRLWYFQNTLIENIKIIRPGKYSADGFDFHHFNKVTINKCFVANCDDAVSPKAFWDGDDNQFLYVNDMVLFSTNNNGLLATYEGLSTVDIHDFYFKNCDVAGFFPIPWIIDRQGGYVCFIANNDGVDGLLLKRITTAPTIDGKPDELWLQQKKYTAAKKFNAIAVQNNSLPGPDDLTANFRAAWDNQNLYFIAEIIDDIIIKDTDFKDVWWFRDDGVELLLDTKNGKQPFYGDNTFRYRFRYNDNLITEIGQPISEHNGKTSGIIDGVVITFGTITGGYVIEAKMPWSTLKCSPAHGKLIGFEMLVTDDDDGGDADHMYAWWNGWKDEESKPVFAVSLGEAKLVDPTATKAATPVKTGVKEFSIVKAARDELKIDLDSDAIVKLRRADGRVMLMQATNRGKAVIATGGLACGFYLLEVADGKQRKHQRLIIQ